MSEANNEARTIRFISKFLNLRIVKNSTYNKEVDGRVVTVPGVSIRFQEGMYATNDQEIVEFIRARQEFKDGMIGEVPENVNALVHRQDVLKTLEEKDAEIAKLKAELQSKDLKAGGAEEGAPVQSYVDLTRKELAQLAKDADIEVLAKDTKADIIAKLEVVDTEEVPAGEAY